MDIEQRLSELEDRVEALENTGRRSISKYGLWYNKLDTLEVGKNKTITCPDEQTARGVSQGLHSHFKSRGKRFKTMLCDKIVICHRIK